MIWAFAETQTAYIGPVRALGSDAQTQASGILALQSGTVYLLGNAAVRHETSTCAG
jgi:hypothetical protein